MSRIKKSFEKLQAKGDGAFVAYVCAGDPDLDFSLELVHRLSDAGADVIELGLPFSDPVADGPVIQDAMGRALASGFTTEHMFALIRAARDRGVLAPIVIMTYYNPVLQYGPEAFCKAAAGAGADGLLIVDLPPEESRGLDKLAYARGMDVIRLVAPSTSDQRLEEILSRASGFVYAVSVAGTTGARSHLPPSAGPLVSKVSSKSRSPVVLGFGISTPAHVKAALSMGASGVVEGSALIAACSAEMPQRSRALEAVEKHVREMKRATVGNLTIRQPAQP